MARRHHIKYSGQVEKPCIECEAGAYIKGKEEKKTFVFRGHDNVWVNPYDYRKEPPAKNQGCDIQQYVNTVRIGEHEVTKNALAWDYGDSNAWKDPTYLKNIGIKQGEVDAITGVNGTERSKFIRQFGGYIYPWETGTADWKDKANWDIFIKNEGSIESKVIKEADESELTDSVKGEISNPYFKFWYKSVCPFLKNAGSYKIDKIVVYFATAGKVRLTINFIDASKRIQKEFKVVEGKNELIIDIDEFVGGANVRDFSITPMEGMMKINKQRVHPEFGPIRYQPVRDDAGGNVGSVYDWDAGIGIYYKVSSAVDLVDPNWDILDKTSVLQMIGLAPGANATNKGAFFGAIRNFFWVDWDTVKQSDVPFSEDKAKIYDSSNISGASWFPMGSKYNDSRSSYGVETSIILYLKNEKRFNIIKSGVGGIEPDTIIITENNSAHATLVYLCKTLSEEELGYQLYIDEANNKVLKVDFPLSEKDKARVEKLEKLPNGLLRGIALRYYNKAKDKICMCLSGLREEEEKINNNLKTIWINNSN